MSTADSPGGSPTTGLVLDDVSLVVGGRLLFDSVHLAVPSGRAVAVMGPSGSGKTSLLNAMAGLLPCRGRIALDGSDLTALPARRREAFRLLRIGMVFQESDLLPELTVLENAELPGRLSGQERAEYRSRAEATLNEVGLADRGGSWPSELSGGERQRVAVARALHNKPALLLADEPTGALDVANRDIVSALLVDVARTTGSVVLIATHDPAVAEFCDSVYVCQHAALVEAQDAFA